MLTFEQIIGQEPMKEYFRNAIRQNKISHAYILSGEDGMGKMTLANAFAHALICEEGQAIPCMSCHSCQQFLTGNHPDVVYVKHEKSGSIGVDDVRRQIVNDVLIKPYNGGRKIYIIDEAEKMTVQAQNALLKTIEEPPAYAVLLFLTTNADAFLPTILSRCVLLKPMPLDRKDIERYLTVQMSVENPRAQVCAAFARGNLGKAIALSSSEEFMEMKNSVTILLKKINELSVIEFIERMKLIRDDGINIHECLNFMELWYRDVLLFKATLDMNLLLFGAEYRYISEAANHFSFEGIGSILDALGKVRVRLEANVNFDLTMELLLLTIKENYHD